MAEDAPNPLDDRTFGLYLREVERQCVFAISEFQRMQEALRIHIQEIDWVFERKQEINAMSEGDEKDSAFQQWSERRKNNQQRVSAASQCFWASAQAFLVAAANVSKLLWPLETKRRNETTEQAEWRRARGSRLRDELGVTANYLVKQKDLRNSFEHFDERLDSWVDSSARHNFADENFGPLAAINGVETTDLMRNYDPTSSILTFQGETLDVIPIVKELADLASRAAQAEKKLPAESWPHPCSDCGFPVVPGEPRCRHCGKER